MIKRESALLFLLFLFYLNSILQFTTASQQQQQQFVTPEDFGAIGDGSTDDTAAFNAAFASGQLVQGRLNAIYLVKDVVIEGRATFDGNNCILRPLSGSKFVLKLLGWEPRIRNVRLEDYEDKIVSVQQLAASANADQYIIRLSPASLSTVDTGMQVAVQLNNGRFHHSFVKTINAATGEITLIDSLSGVANNGNRVSFYYALLVIGGNSTTPTKNWEATSVTFINTSAGILINENSMLGQLSFVTMSDIRYSGLSLFGANITDTFFSDIKIVGGSQIKTSALGNGVTKTFTLSNGSVYLKRDLQAYINGVFTEAYTFLNENQVTFNNAPANNAIVEFWNFRDSATGVVIHSGRKGDRNTWKGLSILDCTFGIKIIGHSSAAFSDIIVDTIYSGIYIEMHPIDNDIGILSFSNSFIGFYHDYGIKLVASGDPSSSACPSFVGYLHTRGTPREYSVVATLGNMFEVDGNLCIDSFGWTVKDEPSQIVLQPNAKIYYTGMNPVYGIDGSLTQPAFSFGSSPSIGIYKAGDDTVGISGNLRIVNEATDFTALSIGNISPNGNPSINFFSSNTGSYNSPSARIQAYGGDSTPGSGTLEFNAANIVVNANSVSIPTVDAALSIGSGSGTAAISFFTGGSTSIPSSQIVASLGNANSPLSGTIEVKSNKFIVENGISGNVIESFIPSTSNLVNIASLELKSAIVEKLGDYSEIRAIFDVRPSSSSSSGVLTSFDINCYGRTSMFPSNYDVFGSGSGLSGVSLLKSISIRSRLGTTRATISLSVTSRDIYTLNLRLYYKK